MTIWNINQGTVPIWISTSASFCFIVVFVVASFKRNIHEPLSSNVHIYPHLSKHHPHISPQPSSSLQRLKQSWVCLFVLFLNRCTSFPSLTTFADAAPVLVCISINSTLKIITSPYTWDPLRRGQGRNKMVALESDLKLIFIVSGTNPRYGYIELKMVTQMCALYCAGVVLIDGIIIIMLKRREKRSPFVEF